MKVSIITASFNRAHTIGDTIESVLKQTYPDIEYWIIDGGSTDGTMNLVRKYEPLFNGRMHYISKPDRGVYDAMNKGIASSTGDIVGILNSDDFFTSSDIVEKIVDAFKSNEKLDAVYGDIHFISNDNPQKIVRYYSSAIFKPALLRFGFMPAHPSFYAKREIFEKFGTYNLNYKIASDYDMMVRLFYKHRIKYAYLKQDFVTMRTGGLSTKSWKNRITITYEDVKACRTYGMYTNILLISLKYLYKIFEFKRILLK